MLSINVRSWVTAIIAPLNIFNSCSKKLRVVKSKWFVGSSSNRISGAVKSSFARRSRVASPPESVDVFCLYSSKGKPKPESSFFIRVSAL